MSGHVFISHGSENSGEASELCAFIEAHGVKAWIAPRDVRPGFDYSEELQRAIEGCTAFVVLVTDMANKSPYVRAETEMAFSNSKPIFPVRMSDIKPAPGLAFFLKIRHWTDAYGATREANLNGLARELQTVSGVAPEAAAPMPPVADAAAPIPPAPAPSTPPPPAPPPAPGAADPELVAAAIGPNADYFLKHWARMDATGKSYDWNWAACLLNFCWFAYRKMWLAAAAIGLVYIVTTPLLDPTDKRPFWTTILVLVAISCVTGGWGNKLYRRQIDRLVVGTAGLGRAEAIEQLKRRGGVSVPGLIVSIVVIFLISIIVTIALLMVQMRRAPASAPPAGAEAAPAEAAAPAGPPTLDEAYLVGRWAEDGDCSTAVEFTADGRFIAAGGGGVASWTLNGDQLTASGPAGDMIMRIAPIDRNTMTLTGPDGTVSNPIRC